jgi:ketosteroid isomerase-like protein
MTDHTNEINELLSIHQQDRQAHFKTDVTSAISFFDDPYYYVRDGGIHQLSPEKLEPMYTNYFEGAKFHEWDDLEQPIIHVSDDGNMAWVIEHFRIRLSREGEETEQVSEYAGITIYEKKSGKWLRVANTSTFAKRE